MSIKLPVLATVLAAFITAAIAVPASTPSVLEVIPGPGLPSLESLGLTSAELYSKKPSTGLISRKEDYNAVCQTYSTASVDDVNSCVTFLQNIGDGACSVNGSVTFCTAGSARISGSSGSQTTSTCNDVASAVQWVVNNCNSNGQVGGSQAAYGNGNLVVSVTHT